MKFRAEHICKSWKSDGIFRNSNEIFRNSDGIFSNSDEILRNSDIIPKGISPEYSPLNLGLKMTAEV